MTVKPLNKILVFTPNYKTVIWGGNSIPALKGEHSDCQRLGESWEISALPGHETIVANGKLKGMNISELSHIYGPKLLGDAVTAKYGNTFPLLIKIIDARQMLSVQVHPDDRLAAERHNSRGKSEMWYVIDADEGAEIYRGLKAPLSPQSYLRHIAAKSIMDVIATFKSRRGQFYYIPSGTIHSIGAGNLLAEIQQSSDITYRVYDHDRTDAYGNLRQLHTQEAIDAIDYSFPNEIEPTAKVIDKTTVNAIKGDHFSVDLYCLNNEKQAVVNSHNSFTALLAVEGSLTVEADGECRTLNAGHSALIPAFVDSITLSGSGRVLSAHL